MTNQQAPEIYTLHTVPNKGERPWSGIYTVRADAEHDAKVMRDVTGRDWSVVRLVVADTNDRVPEELFYADALDRCAEVDFDHIFVPAAAVIRRLHAENERLAALVEAQQLATHVQAQAEIEHVAGDVSKNGAESDMAQQPAPSAASKAVLAAIRAANMQLVRTGDDEFMLVTYKQAAPQADSQPAPAAVAEPSWSDAANWLRNNYQDYPNIASLCEAMLAAAPTPPAQAADSVLEEAARLLRQILAASQDGDSDTHLSAHFVHRIETITKAGGAA